jgi:hypothetical protein
VAERKTIRDIAELIANAILRQNPTVPAVITADLGLVNDTPLVSVSVGGATRQAIYPLPTPIQVGGNVFVARMSADLTSPLVVVASNYQVT